MGFEQYHEPPDELSEKTRTFARMIVSMIEEADAINWYQQRLSLEKNREARAVIWRTMLHAAGLTLIGGTHEDLAEAELNGRQIRNLTRLARIVHPGGEVSLEQMRAVLVFGCA